MERVAEPSDRSQPGPLAIFFSILSGLVVAVVVFAATFVFTCAGLRWDDELGIEFVFVIAGITAIAAFAFTLWGILKIIRAIKQKY